MAIETIGEALDFSWRITVRYAHGPRDGMKRVREGVRRRHHVGDRLRHGHHPQGRPQGRPRQPRHDRQVPAVQILRRDGQRVGVWVEGGVGGRRTPSSAIILKHIVIDDKNES